MLNIDEFSIREVFQPRVEFDPNRDFFAQQINTNEDMSDWVSFKLLLSQNTSRQIFFETAEESKEAKDAILSTQGYSSHLAQYEIISLIGECSSFPIWLARFRFTGQQVAIKAIPDYLYQDRFVQNKISEAEALYMFKQSPNIITLVEEFVEGGTNYIVTKYIPGVPPGVNLLTYIQMKEKRSWQTEEKARHLFTQIALAV